MNYSGFEFRCFFGWDVGRFFCWGMLLLLLPACREKSEQPTLSDEKVARIIADISIAEAATVGLSGYPKDSLLQVYYKQVFQMHGTTKEEYEKNLHILANDVPRMERIQNMALKMLEPEKKTSE